LLFPCYSTYVIYFHVSNAPGPLLWDIAGMYGGIGEEYLPPGPTIVRSSRLMGNRKLLIRSRGLSIGLNMYFMSV